ASDTETLDTAKHYFAQLVLTDFREWPEYIFHHSLESSASQRLYEQMNLAPSLFLIEDQGSPTAYELVVEADEAQLLVAGTTAFPPIDISEEEGIQQFVRQSEKVVHFNKVMDLERSDSSINLGDFGLTVVLSNGSGIEHYRDTFFGTFRQINAKYLYSVDIFEGWSAPFCNIQLRNSGNTGYWIAGGLLSEDLTIDFSYFPQRIESGTQVGMESIFTRGMPYGFPLVVPKANLDAGKNKTTYFFRILICTESFDASVLNQEGLFTPDGQSRAIKTKTANPSNGDWVAINIEIIVENPGATTPPPPASSEPMQAQQQSQQAQQPANDPSQVLSFYAEDFRLLLKAFTEQRVILFLGLEATQLELNGEYKPLVHHFSEHLYQTSKERWGSGPSTNLSDFYEVNAHFIANNDRRRVGLEYALKRFLEQHPVVNDFHRLVAKLPFQLVIQQGFDEALLRAYQEQFMSFQEQVFNYQGEPQPFDLDRRTIYYLNGHIRETDSLVLTDRDRRAHLSNIIKTGLLPVIKEALQYRETYIIFVGVDFSSDDLLQILEQGNYSPAHLTSYAFQDAKGLRTSIRDALNLHIIDRDSLWFFAGLLEYVQANWPETNTAQIPSKARLLLLLKDNQLQEVFDLLEQHKAEWSYPEEPLTVLKGQYDQIIQLTELEKISPEEAQVERHKIMRALIEFIDLNL
ncbi:MAG: SIR2 family protein, partial [Bacteroidota bacterium]